MTNCQKIEKELITYLDAKASPAERRQVEGHLVECAACRERADEFRTVLRLLGELPAAMPSASFDAAVRARIAAEPQRHSWWQALVPSTRMAFATAALVALSVWMVTVQQTRPPITMAQQQATDADFGAIMNLQTLENYDVLANFDALSDLPAQTQAPARR